MRFLSAGEDGLLVELDGLAQTLALYRELTAQPITGVDALIPAACTVLLRHRPAAIGREALVARVLQRADAVGQAQENRPDSGRLVEIPVHYNGEDLTDVAGILGVSVAEVIARHTGQPWQAAFAGFAPGFIYMAGGHPSFQVPRRATPRTRVPAGSVALAGNFSAVYPSASPGGWQLLGVTEVPMWDLARDEPAYVQPGFRVQFVDADRPGVHVSLPPATASDAAVDDEQNQETAGDVPRLPTASAGAVIEIIDAGLQTLFQDAGRHGLAGLGVSPSGALDQAAMRRANRLVGNPVHAPVLENLMGRLQLRSRGRTTLAVTGAQAQLTVRTAGGRQESLASRQAVALDDGDELRIGPPSAGVRCYVAVRGGWSVTPVLGSVATDTLARLGPAALAAGQQLAVGDAVPKDQLTAVHTASLGLPALPRPGDTVALDIVLGPRTDWFTDEAVELLSTQAWRVTPQSDRIGMRLAGDEALTRRHHDELPSEGTVTGAIQVPASGQPLLFLADHPLTVGYPVIAALARHHVDLAAQIPVGCLLRFRVVAPFFHVTRTPEGSA